MDEGGFNEKTPLIPETGKGDDDGCSYPWRRCIYGVRHWTLENLLISTAQ